LHGIEGEIGLVFSGGAAWVFLGVNIGLEGGSAESEIGIESDFFLL
jgi:hypothetical protein